MNFKIIFDPVASNELLENVIWYRSNDLKLGVSFYGNVKKVIDSIQYNPYQFPIKYKKFRVAKVSSFPYIIVYFVVEEINEVVISAIFHTSRNPKIWKGRYRK